MPDLNAKLVGKIQSTFRSYMVSSKTCKYDALYMKIHEDDAVRVRHVGVRARARSCCICEWHMYHVAWHVHNM